MAIPTNFIDQLFFNFIYFKTALILVPQQKIRRKIINIRLLLHLVKPGDVEGGDGALRVAVQFAE
jgi:hypothetical protein